jgi:hypothetical protein
MRSAGAGLPADHRHRPRPRRGAPSGTGVSPAVGARAGEQGDQAGAARCGAGPALPESGDGAAGDLRLPAGPLRAQRPALPRGDRGRNRPGPDQVHPHCAHRAPRRHRRCGLFPLTACPPDGLSALTASILRDITRSKRTSTPGAVSAVIHTSSSGPATTATASNGPRATAERHGRPPTVRLADPLAHTAPARST